MAHKASASRYIAIWLFICCLLVAAMVVVGGATRLTESGLSITKWKPISGIVPPMSDQAWQEEFVQYQQSPQGQITNRGMTVEEFKGIFWLEFIHRLLGRLTGIVFFVPLLVFIARRQVDKALGLKLGGIFLLGGTQGLIGWYMVASGLKVTPQVSPYWLAFHLGTALLIFSLIVLLGLRQLSLPRAATTLPFPVRLGAYIVLAMVFCQALLGAFVAGLDAGLVYNTFPDMNGVFVPSELGMLTPWYRNLFENVTTVQFNHRMMAYSLTAAIIVFALSSWRYVRADRVLARAIIAQVVMLAVQFTLGVLTLLHQVPVVLGCLHQAGAVVLLSVSLVVAYRAGPLGLQQNKENAGKSAQYCV